MTLWWGCRSLESRFAEDEHDMWRWIAHLNPGYELNSAPWKLEVRVNSHCWTDESNCWVFLLDWLAEELAFSHFLDEAYILSNTVLLQLRRQWFWSVNVLLYCVFNGPIPYYIHTSTRVVWCVCPIPGLSSTALSLGLFPLVLPCIFYPI